MSRTEVSSTLQPQLPVWELPPRIVAERTNDQELVERGYHSGFEVAHARALYEALGETGLIIASYEHVNNRECRRREFLDDEPVSFGNTYWTYQNSFRSFPLADDITSVESGIHEDEREGLTKKGFNRFQQLVAEANSGEVVVWYSPAGPGGTEGVFSQLHYDAGRLYLACKQNEHESIHVDVKVGEDGEVHFPITDVLNAFSGQTTDSAYHYLEHPFVAGTYDELFGRLHQALARTGLSPDTLLYISRRTEPDKRRVHCMNDVFDEIHRQVTQTPERTRRLLREAHATRRVLTQSMIRHNYDLDVYDFAQHEGLNTVVMYGCSTTSTLSGLLSPFTNNSTSYGTMSRIMSGGSGLDVPSPEGEKSSYKFENKGKCQTCKKSHTLVGLLGPCLICRSCDGILRKKQNQTFVYLT